MPYFRLSALTLIFAFFLFFFAVQAQAIVNPLDFPNNRFGIHILNPSDLKSAQELVNSSGGDWGYVTLVIQENDRDIKRWQKVFNEMRRFHLIPIIRIASQQENNGWKKLEISDIESWIYFLNSLNWVIKNRYLVIGNEPNYANEWGGQVDSQEYAKYFIEFSKKAREASDNFFMIPAALDASAPDNREYLSEENFIKEILGTYPDFYDFADGFASHSYPNPGFLGSEKASGKGSIKTFEWESNLLKSFNVNKNLPLFITETGWIHDKDGEFSKNNKLSNLSEKYQYAFENVWNDPRIVAVTPFVLAYNEEPFASFSWKKKDGTYFGFYDDVKNLPKTKGSPLQEENGQILFLIAPNIGKKASFINAIFLIKNTGQSIWESGEVNMVEIINGKVFFTIPINQNIEPEQKIYISHEIAIPDLEGNISGIIRFAKNEKIFGNDYKFNILALKPLTSPSDLFHEFRQIIYNDPINKLFNEFKSVIW